LFFTGCNSNSGSVSTNVSLESNIDSVSYSLGYQIAAMSLKRQGMDDVKPAKFASGLKTALSEDSSMLSDAEMQQVVQTYQMQAQQKAQQEQQEKASENKRKGEEFLAENKNNEGVQVTDSG